MGLLSLFGKRTKKYGSLKEALDELGINPGRLVTSFGTPMTVLRFRKGRIEVVAEVRVGVSVDVNVQAYEEIRSEGTGVVIRIGSNFKNPQIFKLEETVGYLIGDNKYYKQLRSDRAVLEQLQPLTVALARRYVWQQVQQMEPEDSQGRVRTAEQLQGLERTIGRYEQFTPIVTK